MPTYDLCFMPILEKFESILSKSKSLSKSIDNVVWLDFDLDFDDDFDSIISNLLSFGFKRQMLICLFNSILTPD